jgi:O-antigen/teichoic acid export membrane protein
MNNQNSPVSTELPDKKTLAKNVLYNFLGYGSPLLFAIVLIPPLIKELGDERFGILSIAWMVLGYFSLLDFGIGRGLTKIISEKIALNFSDQVPGLFWTSIFLMFLVSSFTAIVILFLVPFLVESFFNISENVKEETLYSFYALAVSIPIIATTAALRGVLEAYQKFFAINIVRIFLGVFTFLGPILVLLVVNSLFWIIVIMIIVRLIVWVTYFYLCLTVNSAIKNNLTIRFKIFKPVLKFSIWISIANIVGPIISYSDRIIIGSAISAAAITYYSTPYEVVTKLLLIPGALVGVLFPFFSASFATVPAKAKELFTKGAKYIFLIMFPAVFLLVTFASDGLNIWLGEKFAANSTSVMQFLSIGILMNSFSLIPNVFFQGTGKPHIPTLLNLVELPFYVFGMWLMISNYGIDGAALFYMIAAAIDAFIMYFFAYKVFRLRFNSVFPVIFLVACILLLLIMITVQGIVLKLILSLIILVSFVYTVWKYFLTEDERIFFVSKIRSLKLN